MRAARALRETPRQIFRRRDLLLAPGVGFALLGNPDIFAQGFDALPRISFGVFQHHVAHQQAFGDHRGGAAPLAVRGELVLLRRSLIQDYGLGVGGFRCFAYAVRLIRHVLDQRAENPEIGER